MTYVVTDACIKCKYMDCVEVCPVDCFYEGDNMLVINPSECIDCGVCEPECPAEAILPDTESGLEQWLELNTKFSAEWPNITTKKDSPADADEFKGVDGKFDTYFSAEPGEGDCFFAAARRLNTRQKQQTSGAIRASGNFVAGVLYHVPRPAGFWSCKHKASRTDGIQDSG